MLFRSLSIQRVTKTFGSYTAVDDIDLEVKQGEIFGFLRPNGAGKSTTIRLLLDILRPDSGSIEILGISNRQTAALHHDIGYLSGDMTLDDDLTGRQYLDFINNLHGGSFRRPLKVLAEVLEADLTKTIGAYSRGNRQKIALIAALLHNPKLLVLDEPTTGFDPLIQEKFAEIIREYVAHGGTVFMSSHMLGEVQNLCDRVAFIKSGRIVATHSIHELLEVAAKRVTVTAGKKTLDDLIKRAGERAGLSVLDQEHGRVEFSYRGDIQPLLRFFAAKKLDDITIREPELEEIFGQFYETSPAETRHA